MILPILLPAITAAFPESAVASASAAYSFVRTFGCIWSVTIASIIFNSEFNNNLSSISSSTLQKELQDGAAYSFASHVHELRGKYAASLWNEVVQAYVKSLRTIWWVGLAFSLVGFFVVGAERGLELRSELETEYDVDEDS